MFKNAVIANVLPSIPVPNDERKQEQESRAKHSQVTCTSKLSPGIFPAVLQERCSCVFLFALMHTSPAPVMTLLLNRNNLGSKLCVCLYIWSLQKGRPIRFWHKCLSWKCIQSPSLQRNLNDIGNVLETLRINFKFQLRVIGRLPYRIALPPFWRGSIGYATMGTPYGVPIVTPYTTNNLPSVWSPLKYLNHWIKALRALVGRLSLDVALRKHAYSNIQKISPQKLKFFKWKILINFTFLLKTQVVGTR